MGRDLSQLLLLIGGQIRLYVPGVASDQVNSRTDHHIQVNDPGAAAFSQRPLLDSIPHCGIVDFAGSKTDAPAINQ